MLNGNPNIPDQHASLYKNARHMKGHWAGVKILLDHDIFSIDNDRPHSYIFYFEHEKRHKLSTIKKRIAGTKNTIQKRRKSR
jgi:hypothetical protein